MGQAQQRRPSVVARDCSPWASASRSRVAGRTHVWQCKGSIHAIRSALGLTLELAQFDYGVEVAAIFWKTIDPYPLVDIFALDYWANLAVSAQASLLPAQVLGSYAKN